MRHSYVAGLLLVCTSIVSACGGRPSAEPAKVVATPPASSSPVSSVLVEPPKQEAPKVEPPKVEPPKQEPPKVEAPAPEVPKPAPTNPVRLTIPVPVRGIHLSGWVAGSPDLLESLLTWGKSAGINTVVLEIKAEDGKVSWNSDVPLAVEIGANARKIGDIERLIRDLHQAGIWVAGRIVVMNDQYLYRGRPAWAIPGFAGGAYSFMDPHNENVWKYNIDLAKAAVKVGFDEIQFDYIRYPEKLVTGYNRDTGADYRTAGITGLLKAAVKELKPLGAVISADVFGLTTSVAEGDDMQIGQDYKQIIDTVDYISAMVYPSHYADYTYGIPRPDNNPYETVKQSMKKALERTPGVPPEKHRPWIQDFTYPKAGALTYGKVQILDQVRALQELGIESFLLWDPSNKYTRNIDFRKEPAR